jgi:hypothetical protein
MNWMVEVFRIIPSAGSPKWLSESCSIIYVVFIHKKLETDNLSPSSAKIKNVWIITFMISTTSEHKDNLCH